MTVRSGKIYVEVDAHYNIDATKRRWVREGICPFCRRPMEEAPSYAGGNDVQREQWICDPCTTVFWLNKRDIL